MSFLCVCVSHLCFVFLRNSDSGNTTEPDQTEHKVTQTEGETDAETKVASNIKPSQQTWIPGPISICTACTCSRTARTLPTPLAVPPESGSDASHSDSEPESEDSDEEGWKSKLKICGTVTG